MSPNVIPPDGRILYFARDRAMFGFLSHFHPALIALDGETEIRTPYDNCLLVMPSLRPSRGHTAVRLARFVD